MSYVQFRIHPSIGLARYGDSHELYYVGSDFPTFMQERFPKTRNFPKSRTHPENWEGDWPSNDVKTGTLASYNIFDNTLGKDTNYKDNNDKIKPQAARFRVYAYVYNNKSSRQPRKVFELDADTADITWTVQLANRKSNIGGKDIDTVVSKTLEAKQSQAATLEAKRFKEGEKPTLAYMMLERESADKNKLTGRLHLIGNEGECKGTKRTSSLWSDEWFDSGCDGPVRAKISIKDFNAFKSKVSRRVNETVKYLDADKADAVTAAANTEVTAVPSWAVVGPPDYCPNMGHFVSVWDLGLNSAMECAINSKVLSQAKLHKQIKDKSEAERYRKVDYLIHIHPQLCLFSDANFVSGVAKGDGPQRPGHNNNRAVSNTNTPRGLSLDARDSIQMAELLDVKAQKVLASGDLNKKKKPAIYSRLRPAGTLYTYFKKTRHFIEDKNGGGDAQTKTLFPRNLGRRVEYKTAQAARHSPTFVFPHYQGDVDNPAEIDNLRAFHSNTDADMVIIKDGDPVFTVKGKACGKTLNLVTFKDGLDNIDSLNIKLVDDMYWPATIADMPMLRDLAYTHFQNWQFKVWQAPAKGLGAKMSQIFKRMISKSLKTALETESDDRDQKFDAFAQACPKHAPALIDMAYAGSMIGGSFMPGIEAGREMAVATNWTMLHGGSDDFPDLRLKSCTKEPEHLSGRFTKDLAIPWQKDFIACDEAFWPTACPGMVNEGAAEPVYWLIDDLDYGSRAVTLLEEITYFNRYWKDLGFVKREADNKFINSEVKRP